MKRLKPRSETSITQKLVGPLAFALIPLAFAFYPWFLYQIRGDIHTLDLNL